MKCKKATYARGVGGLWWLLAGIKTNATTRWTFVVALNQDRIIAGGDSVIAIKGAESGKWKCRAGGKGRVLTKASKQ